MKKTKWKSSLFVFLLIFSIMTNVINVVATNENTETSTEIAKENSESIDNESKEQLVEKSELHSESKDVTTDREKFSTSISWDPNSDKKEHYCDEEILLYANFMASGGNTSIEKGGYLLIEIPKEKFQMPKDVEISSHTLLDSKEITSDDNSYKIKLNLKEIVAGNEGGIPFRLFFAMHQVKNGEKHNIKITFHKNNDEIIAQNEFTLTSKAIIPNIRDWHWGFIQPQKELIDGKFQSQIELFDILPQTVIDTHRLDPRKAKMVVELPFNLTPSDPSWKHLDGNKYEKEYDNTSTVIPMVSSDIKGLKFEDKKTVEVKYTKYIKNFDDTDWDFVATATYIHKMAPPPEAHPQEGAAELNISYNYTPRLIDNQGNIVCSGSISLPYSKEEIEKSYIIERYNPDYSVFTGQSKKGNESAPKKFVLKEIDYPVPDSIDIEAIRIIDTTNFLPKGIKVYGTANGSEELLTEDCYIVDADKIANVKQLKDWQKITPKSYTNFKIVFPGDGIVINGKEDFEKLVNDGWAFERLSKIQDKVYEEMEKQIEEGKTPGGNYYSKSQAKAVSTAVYYQYEDSIKELPISNAHQPLPYVFYKTNYLKATPAYFGVKRNLGTSWTGADKYNFYVGDHLRLSSSMYFQRYGTVDSVYAKELTINLLVPIGIEPIKDQANFKDVVVKPSEKSGYQLVVAKPVKIDFPYLEKSDIMSAGWDFEFEVKPWCKPGNQEVYSAFLMDNNFPVYNKGRAAGYIMGEAKEPFLNLYKNGENHPISDKHLVYLGKKEFSVSPPLQLVGLTKVKLADEGNEMYAHTTSRKITKNTRKVNINYRHEFTNKTTHSISNVIFLNILPYKDDIAPVPGKDGSYAQRGSSFRTPLTGEVKSEDFDIWYSTDEPGKTLEENMNKNFVKNPQDYSKVTMIKGVLKTGKKIEPNQTKYVVTNNEVNENKLKPKEYAANSIAFSVGNTLTKDIALEGYEARVNVFEPVRDVKIKKIDKETGNPLKNVGFTLYKKGENTPLTQEHFTDKNGEIIFLNLDIDNTYVLKESSVPKGYEKIEDIEFELREDGTYVNNKKIDIIEISNEHLKPKINIDVTKKWQDVKGNEAEAPVDSIKVRLYKDGQSTGKEEELNAGNNWKATFKDLAVSESLISAKHIYTVKELDGEGNPVDSGSNAKYGKEYYKSTVTGTMEKGFVITNKAHSPLIPMIPPESDIKVTKEWKDSLGNNLNEAPVDKIKVELYKDGTATGDIKELTKDNNWMVTFEKLKVYESIENPAIHKYTVKEVGEVGSAVQFNGKWFGVSYDGTMADGFTITNKEKTPWTPMIPPTRNIKVTKAWNLLEGSNIPDTEIEVELYKDGEATGKKLELTKDNNWTGEFKNLEVADGLGSTNYYKYTVKEVGESGAAIQLVGKWYGVSYDGTMADGFTITNKEKTPWTPMEPPTRTIKVTKEWKNDNGNVLTAPVEKIEVELYKDGVATGKKLELTKDNNWTGEFKNLEVADGIGSTNYYKYTVKEIGETTGSIKFDGKWFKVSYTGSMKDGFTITNQKEKSWTPMEPPIREIKVTKLWKDHKGNTITAPTDKITVELYKDGNPTGKTLDLNVSNNWSGAFKNLEVANGLGSTDYYKYTVKEVGEDGNAIKFDGKQYKVVYGGSIKDGLTITNEKEAPPTPPTSPNTEKPKVPNTSTNKTLPKTGDETNGVMYISLILLSLAILILIYIKKDEEEIE